MNVENAKPVLLVVEDDESTQKLMYFFLRDLYELHFADTVTKSKEIMDENPIDMVLLDLSLAGDEDGLDLARYLRKTEQWADLPIVATTAHAFTSDRTRCMEAGCTDYLAKPINRSLLMETIKKWLKSDSG
ncbi:MAG: response regulator [Fidelibacterota bacterium]